MKLYNADSEKMERNKKLIFLLKVLGAIFLFLLVIAIFTGKKNSSWDNTGTDRWICCNCWGEGKIKSFGTTTICKYCYGTGHLSDREHSEKCK